MVANDETFRCLNGLLKREDIEKIIEILDYMTIKTRLKLINHYCLQSILSLSQVTSLTMYQNCYMVMVINDHMFLELSVKEARSENAE